MRWWIIKWYQLVLDGTGQNSDSIFLLKFPLYFLVVLSPDPPVAPLSPTNVRHFLTSPVVNLLTSYPRATKKKHQNVRTFPSAIDEIQTILASIASLCALEMFVCCSQIFCKEICTFFPNAFPTLKVFCSSQDKNVACDCFIFHNAFWKTFPSQQENFLFMKNNIEHSGRQSLPHSGRSIIRTICEAQHRRLPACSRKYLLLLMKNNIECFLCDVPNMGLPAHSVFPLLTLFIIS